MKCARIVIILVIHAMKIIYLKIVPLAIRTIREYLHKYKDNMEDVIVLNFITILTNLNVHCAIIVAINAIKLDALIAKAHNQNGI